MSPKAVLLALSLTMSASAAYCDFVGQLQFSPEGCETTGACRLKYDFGYIDPNGIGWVTVAGDLTDGASIPEWAQPFIGKPYDQSFIKAAVIHDHYCDRHVRPESQTHRAFYDALVEASVPPAKAKLMYYAVVVGATHWKDLIEGLSCNVGDNCIQNIGGKGDLHGGNLVTLSDGTKKLVWPETYDTLAFQKDLQQAEIIINKIGDTLGPNDIAVLAKYRHPDAFYLQTGDSILFQDESSQFPRE